ncbi:MAG TPA: SDR family oxidoreductase [Gemmatimonadaceae bacterium]|nr:SDR family oxidoreductase [Gemmatimonadaceae bacterium]
MTHTPPAPRDETALITGASGGIGYELARLFARDGYALILVARSVPKLEALARDMTARYGARATVIPADLSRPESIPAIATALREAGLTVDILVNNAGVGRAGAFAATEAAAEAAMLQLNVGALVALTALLLPPMVQRGHGRILNVASTAAFVPGPFMAGYYASKAYVLSLSEALASELRGTGVTVTTLAPGPTHTGFQAAANLQRSALFRTGNVMDAATVARAGYRGLMQGKRLVVPGVMNKLLVFGTRFIPRRATAAIARWLNEPKATPPAGTRAGQ